MKYKKIIISALILAIVLSVGFIAFSFNDSEQNLTLNESLEVASKKAIDWNPKAMLLSMTSVDNPDLVEEYDGHDGKRRYWNFQFAVPKTDKQLVITIHDRQVIGLTEVKGSITDEDILISQNEIKFTSQNAIKKASSYFNINPGKNWAAGYHFTLNKLNKEPIICVVCADEEGYFSRISFNATNGKIISALHKIPTGGGLFHNNKKINLNTNSLVSMVGTSSSPNFQVDNTMLTWYLINPLKLNMSLVASITNDGGTTWRNLNIKDDFTKIFFSDSYSRDNTIYAITSQGLISSKDYGNTWTTILSSQTPIINASTYKNKILVLTDNGLELSADTGKTWSKLNSPQNIKYASLDFEGNILTNSNNEIFKENNKSWLKINAPIEGNILGLETNEEYLFVYTDSNIKILELKTNEWKTVNLMGIQKIFVTPSYQGTSQIYVLLSDNTLTKLELNKNSGLWVPESLNLSNYSEGKIVNLISGSTNSLYVSICSDSKWEEIKRGNN